MTNAELETAVADAIHRGDGDALERLFREHPNLIEWRWRGGPPWWRMACDAKSTAPGTILLKLGVVKLDDRISDVIREGDVKSMRELFAAYPQMLHRGCRDGADSWLSDAAYAHRMDMAQALLDMGVDVNQGKYYAHDENALFSALVVDDPQMLRLLLEHGANAKQYKSVIGAITNKKHALEMVKLLEQYGADLHEVFMNELTNTPMNALSTAIDWGQEEVADYLRSKGCVLPPPPAPGEETPIAAQVVRSLSDEVIDYFEENFGPVQKPSLIEIVPTGIPVAVHFIPAAPHRQYVTLFTTGLSSHPMPVPEDMENYSRAELFIQLPADWKIHEYGDPIWGWPHHWLRTLAQYPSHHDIWFGGPAAIFSSGDPPKPLAPNVRFDALLVLGERDFISEEGHVIQLYRMTPLYPEERELELREGIGALLRAFDRQSVPFIVDLQRPNVATSG